MASVLATRFPEKAQELWAYQSTILKAAHNYEGSNSVAYDRHFRKEMLARRDLNWSATNTRFYNEAFTGRARTIPRCPHCLSEDHSGASCPHNPNPPILGWLQPPMPVQWVQPPHSPAAAQRPTPAREVCRSYNMLLVHPMPLRPRMLRVRGSPRGTELPVATPAPRPRARSSGPPCGTVPSEPGTPLSARPGRRRTRTAAAAPVNSASQTSGSSVAR